MVAFRRAVVILVTGTLSYAGATVAQTGPGGDPPGRVGRLAFLQGTVSFHDNEQTDWAPALVNSPITTGDAIWTEPNARSEISIAGTRVRLDSASQLDMLALDDTQTRMQLDQGRIDIKTFTYDTRQPYEIVTPRGTVSLQQQGDYYVEAGTTQDPTRLGVRQGAAQIQTPNGQVLAVRAGEVGEVSGDGSAPQLHTIHTAPPPMPAYWAERDRQVVYDQPPQYLSASVTGYEDLNYYGSWTNDPEYGQVWYARSVPDGWAPYSTGRWTYEQTYGWTWVDEQPWGFAPYHYGRWAQRNNRWFWVPPERQQRAVYAPALVAFVGGTELGLAIGAQNRAPVGWFPLGPREVYVPPYTTNRDYYRRVNLAARVQENILEDRWQRAQRHEAIVENNQQLALMNRRFATVVPAEDFARSRSVERVAIRVPADKIATAPVAFVSAPPSPTMSIRAVQAPGNSPAAPNAPPRPNEPNARPSAQGQATVQGQASVPTRFANMQAIKPEPERAKAPGPQIVSRAAVTGTSPNKPALPQLAPHNAAAPPPVRIEGERQPAQASAPATTPPAAPPRPGEPNRAEPQRPGQPPQPGQANLPPVRNPNDHRPEPPRPGEPPKPPQAQTAPQPAHPAEPPKPPQAQTAPQPAHPAEPPKPPQAQAAPQPPHPAEPPKLPQAQTAPLAQPPHPAPAAPQPQRQAAPAPQPAPPPPQPQHQAAPPAPPPAQAHAPAPPPPPQPQRPVAPPAPPPQAQAPHPAPPPPQVQPPHPAPPPQQAQVPHPAPAPAPQQPHPPQGQPNNNEKK